MENKSKFIDDSLSKMMIWMDAHSFVLPLIRKIYSVSFLKREAIWIFLASFIFKSLHRGSMTPLLLVTWNITLNSLQVNGFEWERWDPFKVQSHTHTDTNRIFIDFCSFYIPSSCWCFWFLIAVGHVLVVE